MLHFGVRRFYAHFLRAFRLGFLGDFDMAELEATLDDEQARSTFIDQVDATGTWAGFAQTDRQTRGRGGAGQERTERHDMSGCWCW